MMVRLAPWLAVSLLVACGGSAPPASAPSNEPAQAAPAASAPRDDPKDEVKPLGSPAEEAVRDPRGNRVRRIVTQLLKSEIAALEISFKDATTDADRLKLAKRLAFLWFELEYNAARIWREEWTMKRNASASEAAALTKKAHPKVLQAYERLVDSFHDDPDRDEALYYVALQHERLGDVSSARNRMLALTKEYPESRFLPHAHFALGIYARAESKTDDAKKAFAVAAEKGTGKLAEIARKEALRP